MAPLGFERIVGFAVVGEVTEVLDGVFEERSGSENGQADGSAGDGTGDGEGEASGFAKEGEDAEEFGGHTSVDWCQLEEGFRSVTQSRAGGRMSARSKAGSEGEVGW